MKIVENFKKIQDLPLIKRKIIFWIVITVFGLIMFAGYILNVKHKIENFPLQRSLEELKIPQLKEEFKKLPKFEIEKPFGEMKTNVKEIERLIEEAERQKKQE
jgi:Tfp pilus assembly protein PilO